MTQAPSQISSQLALFLDVDGTLLDVAPTPDAVVVPPQLPQLLSNLRERLDGAVALISGRSLDELDLLFAPYRFCGAGAHGCEVRIPGASTVKAMVDEGVVAMIHAGCRSLPTLCQGILVEYKDFGAAIHYRLAPQTEPLVAARAKALLRQIGPGFELQPGKFVYEIKPAGTSKGSAITELMSCTTFIGRRPIFIGDDVTDEHGFEAVNILGGISIKVGLDSPTIAKQRVASPAEVHRLLAQLAEQDEATPTLPTCLTASIHERRNRELP